MRFLVACLVAGLVGTLCVPASSVSAAPAPASVSGAVFVPVAPCRLLDTREVAGPVDSVQVPVSGRCGVPAGAGSVQVTVTAVSPTIPGFVTVFPSAATRPAVSTLNFAAGEIRANSTVVGLSDGSFMLTALTRTDVVIDVSGAFLPAASGTSGRFTGLPVAVRAVDTRESGRPADGVVRVALPAGVPADATAVVANITVTDGARPGFVTVWPAGTARPWASMLNTDTAGQVRAGALIVPVSSAGLDVFFSGAGHVIVDISGYFTGGSAPAASDGLFVAQTPPRLFDSRSANHPIAGGAPVLVRTYLPAGAGAAVVNVTATDPAAPGFVTVYPAGSTLPGTSTVNVDRAGQTVANMAISTVGRDGLAVFTMAPAHVIVDLAGYFTGTTPAVTAAAPAEHVWQPAAPVADPGLAAAMVAAIGESRWAVMSQWATVTASSEMIELSTGGGRASAWVDWTTLTLTVDTAWTTWPTAARTRLLQHESAHLWHAKAASMDPAIDTETDRVVAVLGRSMSDECVADLLATRLYSVPVGNGSYAYGSLAVCAPVAGLVDMVAATVPA